MRMTQMLTLQVGTDVDRCMRNRCKHGAKHCLQMEKKKACGQTVGGRNLFTTFSKSCYKPSCSLFNIAGFLNKKLNGTNPAPPQASISTTLI